MSDSKVTYLSKSRYLSGLQCDKKLWTEVRAPGLVPPVDPATQARFDQGHEVGELAKQLFPGGLEIGPRVRRWERVVADTQRALPQRRPLFEAAFRSGGAACRVDVLAPIGDTGWEVLEVKSSTGVKGVHLEDLALQAHVLESAGLEVSDYYVVHLDPSYVRLGGELEIERLFHRENVTETVRSERSQVPDRLSRMQAVLVRAERPEVPIGPFCDEPYRCALHEECWSFLPPLSVFDLIGGRRRAFDYLEQGIDELGDVQPTEDLERAQRIQLATIRAGRPHVDRPALQEFLDELSYPLHFFDLETVAPAVPLFDRSSPYQAIPFLFSIHRQESPGAEARHYVYLSDGAGDPRPDFMRAVSTSLGEEGSIVAYNASFEKRVLQETVAAVGGELEGWVGRSMDRFIDLLRPFRSLAYHHPGQRGRVALKAVLEPLTGLSYDALEIASGELASTSYLRYLKQDLDGQELRQVLRQLEDYCSLDTAGMVAIVQALRAAVREAEN